MIAGKVPALPASRLKRATEPLYQLDGIESKVLPIPIDPCCTFHSTQFVHKLQHRLVGEVHEDINNATVGCSVARHGQDGKTTPNPLSLVMDRDAQEGQLPNAILILLDNGNTCEFAVDFGLPSLDGTVRFLKGRRQLSADHALDQPLPLRSSRSRTNELAQSRRVIRSEALVLGRQAERRCLCLFSAAAS